MDFDQKARKIVKEHLGIYDPDYYDIESERVSYLSCNETEVYSLSKHQCNLIHLCFPAHIFFDDAFEKHAPSEEHNFAVNKFVKQLMNVLDESAS